jgi:hypothetical protein
MYNSVDIVAGGMASSTRALRQADGEAPSLASPFHSVDVYRPHTILFLFIYGVRAPLDWPRCRRP